MFIICFCFFNINFPQNGKTFLDLANNVGDIFDRWDMGGSCSKVSLETGPRFKRACVPLERKLSMAVIGLEHNISNSNVLTLILMWLV